ncbi:LpxI family protein, partial [Candidatus Sumerlaeota bacterium]|nr:LpxI family protein [Candidatus Sumerlaeota bacterium]
KANSILNVVTAELESENIHVLDSTLFLRSCLPGKELLTKACPPSEETQADIDFGYELAKQVAGLDIGQTVVVKSQSVVAVEAMEGTDAAIERAADIAGEGIVVVKVSKPQQDRRFDVPVLGLTTIEKLVKVRAAALAFSGGETLFFDEKEAVALAEANKITIIGV